MPACTAVMSTKPLSTVTYVTLLNIERYYYTCNSIGVIGVEAS